MMNPNSIFSNRINVRIDDINFGNHLCHTKFLNIIHNTRALFLKHYNLSELNCFGPSLVMLNLNIDYHNQCFFNDDLEITLAIDKIEKITFSLFYSVFNHTLNKMAAKAVTKMAFIDLKKGKVEKMPAEFLKLMTSLQQKLPAP